MSRDYTLSAVIDLGTGEVIAEEEETFYDEAKTRPGASFCPVGFYVPDWWDVHDDSIIPGSEYWDEANEWPRGTLWLRLGLPRRFDLARATASDS